MDIKTKRAQAHTTTLTTHTYSTQSKTNLDQSTQPKQSTTPDIPSRFNLSGLGSVIARAWENFAGSSDEHEDANKKLLKSETIPETSHQTGEISKPFLHESESLYAKSQFHKKYCHVKRVTPDLTSLSSFSF